MTDTESDQFEIKRGTKQGDPLSSLLFNTVLQYALEGDLKDGRRRTKVFVWATKEKTVSPICDSQMTDYC